MPFSVFALLYCPQPWRVATGGRPREGNAATGVVMAAIMRLAVMTVGGAKAATNPSAGRVSRLYVML